MNEETILEDVSKIEERNPWRDCTTVAAVGPKGQFVYRHFQRGSRFANESIGEVPLRIRDGEIYLAKHYERVGWVLYEDLCKGKVKGVQADLAKWEIWKKIVSDRAAYKDIPSKTMKERSWLHSEVWRRRDEGGVGILTEKEMIAHLASLGIHPESDTDYSALAESEPEPKKGKK